MALSDIQYCHELSISNIPVQWVSKIELFCSELPNFPLVYIHKKMGDIRLYGFPVAIVAVSEQTNETVSVTFQVLSNIDLDTDVEAKRIFLNEMRNRIGVSDKISQDDIESICSPSPQYKDFFHRLWDAIEPTYGKYIPFGRFYEELYAIVRFVAAFQPKTGRQSELRMLYNFMSIFGERIQIRGVWNFCDFFLIPTYEDLINKIFDDFPIFSNLFAAMEKVYHISYCVATDINMPDGQKITIRSQQNAFKQNKAEFIQTLKEWKDHGLLTDKDVFYMDRLVDAFNRFSWRAAFFISSIFMAFIKSYHDWDKDWFMKFYAENFIGFSPKVIACFIQQGFHNKSVIPVDTWVEAFYKGALGIQDNQSFFCSFDDMGKLERIIWLASQANKTNIRQFFNMLWCCRYGINNSKQLRGANPLACYECKLRDVCLGYKQIKDKQVYITNIKAENIKLSNLSDDIIFICITDDSIPKTVFKRKGRHLKKIDEFSGYLLKNNKTPYSSCVINVGDFLDSITPPYDTDVFNVLESGEFS